MIAEILAGLTLTASPDWSKVSDNDGVTIESRPVEGSKLVELRLSTKSTKSVESLCDAAFGDGKFHPDEPDLKKKEILSETADERVTYEQISPPVVANRDYAVRATRVRPAPDTCAIRFQAANELAPKSPDGWVRIEKLYGEWKFVKQADGTTAITYFIFSDPAGSIPTFMVEGSRRTVAQKWIKMVLNRAK